MSGSTRGQHPPLVKDGFFTSNTEYCCDPDLPGDGVLFSTYNKTQKRDESLMTL